MSAEVQVQHAELGADGTFYVERDGQRLAEQVYRKTGDGKTAIIVHTEVDDVLRGEGIARRLTMAAVAWARASGVKLIPVCPVAKAIFDRDPTIRDVLK
jgi:predicted GNAT family acetyltransferase